MTEIFLTLGLVWALLPVVLFLLDSSINFWTRGAFKTYWCYRFQELKYGGRLFNFEYKGIESAATWFMCDFVIQGFLTLIIFGIVDAHGFLPIVVFIISVLLFVAPRYILDLVKAIRYNSKTRKSDEIEDLKYRLARLEGS